MGFSAKTEYGLIALMDLAVLHPDAGLLKTREISRDHGIPERYLEQMLTSLRKAGFLKSVRGPHGGFRLALPLRRSTSPRLRPAWRVRRLLSARAVVMIPVFRPSRFWVAGLKVARAAVLESTTLAQLLQERDSLQQPMPMFYI